MQYQLVSTIAYFGVAATSSGTLTTSGSGWSGWNSSAMTNVINAAHARGPGSAHRHDDGLGDGAAQAALLGSATARASLVSAIVATVRNRAADGVNLDFEPVSTTTSRPVHQLRSPAEGRTGGGGVGVPPDRVHHGGRGDLGDRL